MNQLLENRLETLREAIDQLAEAIDNNLRAVLLRMTCDTSVSEGAPITDISIQARLIRERCLMFVAREHPLASDLKFSMAALRVGHDYERIQELAEALGRRTNKIAASPLQDVVKDMTGIMADILKVHEIIRKAWQHPHTAPGESQTDISPLTTRIYGDISGIQNKIMEAIEVGTGSAETFVELVLACRHLKRIVNTLELIPDELHAFDRN